MLAQKLEIMYQVEGHVNIHTEYAYPDELRNSLSLRNTKPTEKIGTLATANKNRRTQKATKFGEKAVTTISTRVRRTIEINVGLRPHLKPNGRQSSGACCRLRYENALVSALKFLYNDVV